MQFYCNTRDTIFLGVKDVKDLLTEADLASVTAESDKEIAAAHMRLIRTNCKVEACKCPRQTDRGTHRQTVASKNRENRSHECLESSEVVLRVTRDTTVAIERFAIYVPRGKHEIRSSSA